MLTRLIIITIVVLGAGGVALATNPTDTYSLGAYSIPADPRLQLSVDPSLHNYNPQAPGGFCWQNCTLIPQPLNVQPQ